MSFKMPSLLCNRHLLFKCHLEGLHAKWLQSCLTLWDPMDCSPPRPLSTGFSRQEYWSRCHALLQWIFPTLGTLISPVWEMGSFFFFSFIFISWRLITLHYCSGFCHTLTCISHGFTCVPHPYPPSRLPLHPIPLGLPSAPALSTYPGWMSQHPSWAGDLFHPCFNAVLSEHHPRLLPQSLKVGSVHLCLFFCFAYWVIITNFLNSIYIH